ncbi:MAG: phosphatidate cytidylyltransferase [Vibrionaceae bacterium]
MLKQRVLTASLLAPLSIASILFLPLNLFTLVMVFVTLLGVWEWTKFVVDSRRVHAFIMPTLVILGSLFYFWPLKQTAFTFSVLGVQTIALVGAMWWFITCAMIKLYPKRTSWWVGNGFLQQTFGVFSLLPFLWSVLLLRTYQYDVDPTLGAKLVLLVCLLVWAADTGAFFAGKQFGRRKMAPNVSPNKTIAGLIGGLVASVGVMFISVELFAIPFASFFALCIVAVITALASVVGDLAESMFKRAAGVKDSGRILPGHGGILDRIDSLTAAFPVFAVLYFILAQ